jgi:hypothetical protein
MLLRESLVFPYRDGLGFVQALLNEGGSQRAFSQALQQPPRNTREILSPDSYLNKQLVPTMKIPDLEKALGKGYEKYDVGSVGQFDIVLFGKQFSTNVAARELSAAWRGGFYYTALTRQAAKNHGPNTKDLGVVYLSRWSSPEMAKRFGDLYASSFRIKYASATEEAGNWKSEEGPLSIEVIGDRLLVIEGFDPETAARLREATLRESTAPAKTARGDLSLRTMAPIFAVRLMMR